MVRDKINMVGIMYFKSKINIIINLDNHLHSYQVLII